MNGAPVALMVVEDDSMVRGWIRLAVEGSEFWITGDAHDAASAAALLQRRHAHLMLVDYRLPDGTGTELVRALRRQGITTPALLMTATSIRGLNEIAREAGAQGAVLKTGRLDDLLGALRAVRDGEFVFDASHPMRPRREGALSQRERDVVRLVAAGKTNREIASELAIGEQTVKTLLSRASDKLGAHRRAEAVSAAHAKGLL
jgi:DNA-binding NarL/FixJ family response regulator